MDWRDEYDSAIAERNRLIMALTAAEKRAEAAEQRVAELEAQVGEAVFHETDRRNAWKVADKNAARVKELEARLAEMEARADRNQGSADVLDTMEELMFGWEDDD